MSTMEQEQVADTFDPATVSWVMDEEDLEWLVLAISGAVEVVVDLETTGLDEHAETGGQTNGGVAARIALASLTLPEHVGQEQPPTWVVPLSHPESPWCGRWRSIWRALCQAIKASRVPVTNQNMKFDARWTYALTGVDLSSQIAWDTRTASHLLDENESTKLKERAPAVFGVPRWDDFDLKTPGAAERVPLFDLGLYAARDTYWTYRLAEHQRHLMFVESDEGPLGDEEIEHARLGRLMQFCSMPTVRTLTAIEQRGLGLDIEWVSEQIVTLSSEAEELYEHLVGLYDVGLDEDGNVREPSFAPTAHWFRDWAQIAVDRGDLQVAELTPTGKPRWSKGVLHRQARDGSEVAQALLDYRTRVKKLEFLRSWVWNAHDGRIYSTYNEGSVSTGRLSSAGPNMQQVTKALRPAFTPREGYYLADLDYSQIELRVAAFISRCEPMLDAFRKGADLHRLIAAQVTGKTLDEVTDLERQAGKAINFGFLYGMGAYGFMFYADEVYGVQMTRQEAAQAAQTYFETWYGLSQWHARMAVLVQTRGQVVSPLGRVRRLGGGFRPSDDGGPERAGINAPVQGMASDLMQMAAASIEGQLPGVKGVEGVRLVGTVHDSILVEVPIDAWEAKTRECVDRMRGISEWVRTAFGVDIDVPLEAEATVGTRWGLDDVGELT